MTRKTDRVSVLCRANGGKLPTTEKEFNAVIDECLETAVDRIDAEQRAVAYRCGDPHQELTRTERLLCDVLRGRRSILDLL